MEQKRMGASSEQLVHERGKVYELTTEQRNVAEIAFFKKFLNLCNENATEQLPWLRTKELGRDKEIKNRYVTGLVDAYFSLPLGKEGEKKFKSNWGEKSNYLIEQVKHIIPGLEEERDKLFTDAKDWGVREIRKQIRETHRYLAKLPEEQRNLLYERTTLQPETRKKKATRWGLTLGATVGSSMLLEAPATVGGTALVNTHLLQTMDTKGLLALLGVSYASWAYGMHKGIKANINALEQTGMGSNVFSKVAFDNVKHRTLQKITVGTSYVVPEVAKEIPYYAGAFGADAAGIINTKEAIIFLAGANVVAAGYEVAQAKTMDFLVRRSERPFRFKRDKRK